MDFFLLPSWLVVVVVVAVLTIIYLHYSKDNRRKFGLPGPPPLPVFGNIIDMFKYGLCDLDRHFIKMYGKVFALSTGVFGNFLGDIVIADTDMLKEVMVKQASIFSDRNADPDKLVTPIDQSVFSVRGEHWKQMRSTLTPTFSSGKLRHMEAMILKCANTLIKNLKKKAEAKESFDNSVWGCYTMDVICATAFGIEVDSLNNPNHPYVTNAERANSFEMTDPAMIGFLFFPWLMKKLQHILRYVPGFRGALMSSGHRTHLRQRVKVNLSRAGLKRGNEAVYRRVSHGSSLEPKHPKGTCVIIPIYAIHMDPEKYPDPEKFDPERFTPEAKAKRNPYWYMPFGMGPRNCIGMRLALLEMKIILVKVLQNFTLKTCAETQIPLVLSTSNPMKPNSIES